MSTGGDPTHLEKSISVHDYEPVVYRKRWLMLVMFASVSMLNAFQWLHLNIVAESVIYFWNGSLPVGRYSQDVAVAWLSMIYMLVYIPLIIPATWLLNRYGLRLSVIIGAFLNAAGAGIKCISLEISQPIGWSGGSASASFAVLVAAQTVCAMGQVFLLGAPAQIAATWFGQKELALATSIGVFGNQVGCALGFGLPPLMVPAVDYSAAGSTDLSRFDEFKTGFRILLYGGFAIMAADLLVILCFFKNEPEQAPSRAQYGRLLQKRGLLHQPPKPAPGHTARDDLSNSKHVDSSSVSDVAVMTEAEASVKKQGYLGMIAYAFKNFNFIFLNICYGVNTGVYYEIGTLLSVILLEHFPTEQVAIGWVGFSMVIAGLVGSLVAGAVLAKTHLYRRVLIIFYMLSVVSMGFFMGSVYTHSIAVVFVAMICLGFFQSGFLPLGFEYAAEITYPVDEGLSSGSLNTSAHIFGIILTLVATKLEGSYGGFYANLFMLVSMIIAAFPTFFLKDDLKRQQAQEKVMHDVEEMFNDELKAEGSLF